MRVVLAIAVKQSPNQSVRRLLYPRAPDRTAGTSSAIHKYPYPKPIPEDEGASGLGPLKNVKPTTNRCTRSARVMHAGESGSATGDVS